MATQAFVHKVRPAADDDFVICRKALYGQVLVLPIRCLVRPAADDNFVIWLDEEEACSKLFILIVFISTNVVIKN